MKVLVLEDEISHQVRMETTLAEIAKEMGITIKVKVTGKVREFKEYIEELLLNNGKIIVTKQAGLFVCVK